MGVCTNAQLCKGTLYTRGSQIGSWGLRDLERKCSSTFRPPNGLGRGLRAQGGGRGRHVGKEGLFPERSALGGGDLLGLGLPESCVPGCSAPAGRTAEGTLPARRGSPGGGGPCVTGDAGRGRVGPGWGGASAAAATEAPGTRARLRERVAGGSGSARRRHVRVAGPAGELSLGRGGRWGRSPGSSASAPHLQERFRDDSTARLKASDRCDGVMLSGFRQQSDNLSKAIGVQRQRMGLWGSSHSVQPEENQVFSDCWSV
ncbi:uncharacterized protein LOC120887931 [Ictidomys tridecemlineatus]